MVLFAYITAAIMAAYIYIAGLCGSIFLIVMGIVLIAKRKTMLKSLKTIHKELLAIVLIVWGALIITYLIFHLFLNQIESSAYNLYVLIENIDEFLAAMSLFIGIFVITVILLVVGIRNAKKLKTINDADTYSKKRFWTAVLITLGVLGTVISIALSVVRLIAFSIRSTADERDHYFLTYYINHITALSLLILGVTAFTAILWITGIRAARKLKTISDVDIYNKKLVRTAALIISGALGTVVSIVLSIKFVPDCHFYLKCITETIDLYL